MNQRAHSDFNRLDDLLVDRATIGLNHAEHSELTDLLIGLELADDQSVQLTAAAIDLAVGQEESIQLPEHLKAQAMDQARQAFESFDSMASLGSPKSDKISDRSGSEETKQSSRRVRTRDLVGLIAIAASLALAWFAWDSRNVPPPETMTVAEEYQNLLKDPEGDLVQLNWKSTSESDAIQDHGKVIWSDSLQSGFMTFKALEINDPLVEQYQLWIFDETRDAKYPVDGGVFDVSESDGELIVKIDAKIKVNKAVTFAITIEQPEGVVVSDRSRLPLIASLPN